MKRIVLEKQNKAMLLKIADIVGYPYKKQINRNLLIECLMNYTYNEIIKAIMDINKQNHGKK